MLIGIDIGGTNLRIGVVDGLQVIHERRMHADFAGLCAGNTPDIAWQKIIQITSQCLLEVLAAYPQVKAIGIGFPGFIDPRTSKVKQSPNLPGLLDVDLAGDLSRAIGKPVIVENDALAAAYGEFRLSDKPTENMIYLGLGTGVGGGLIYHNQPFPGQHGFAMEVGHIIFEPNGRACGCGNHGCMEQYASATGVVHSYHATTGLTLTTGEIALHANAGDEAAIAAFDLAGESLATVLAHILKVVDVGQTIIGGGLVNAWPLMQSSFFHTLAQDLIPVLRDKVMVTISTTGDVAGIVGAALLAEQKS
ncbi:MAG: ROK family protein [Methylophilaceae bacterium]|nr:ROK family protein [Methyloradius sp.]